MDHDTARVPVRTPTATHAVVLAPSATKAEGNASRYAYIDMIRGIAALAVVLAHCLERGYPGFRTFQGNVLDFGRFGVIAFFVVSGFVIPVSLQRAGSLNSFGSLGSSGSILCIGSHCLPSRSCYLLAPSLARDSTPRTACTGRLTRL